MAEVAVVTGANRGIGLEVARQLGERGMAVVLCARDAASGERAASELAAGGLAVRAARLDVADDASVAALADSLAEDPGRVDVLVNNAGALFSSGRGAVDVDLATVRAAFETNALGAWRTAQALLPLLRRSPSPRIVNVSTGMAALADMGGGSPAYRSSKTALNALTRMLAAELRGERFLVNSVCPGWVATDMGGPAGRPVADGAASVVWAATLPPGGPSGGFFRDGRPIDW